MITCFQAAVSSGLDIAISPHVDDGLGLGMHLPDEAHAKALCGMTAVNARQHASRNNLRLIDCLPYAVMWPVFICRQSHRESTCTYIAAVMSSE